MIPKKVPMDIRLVMKALYASEINCGIQSFWDGEWQAWIGDEMNGIKMEDFNIPFDDLGEWLHESALSLYPTSDYAKRWNDIGEIIVPSFAAGNAQESHE